MREYKPSDYLKYSGFIWFGHRRDPYNKACRIRLPGCPKPERVTDPCNKSSSTPLNSFSATPGAVGVIPPPQVTPRTFSGISGGSHHLGGLLSSFCAVLPAWWPDTDREAHFDSPFRPPGPEGSVSARCGAWLGKVTLRTPCELRLGLSPP